MTKTKLDVEQLKTEAVKSLYAVAGATELAVEVARGYASEAQQVAQDRFDDVQTRVAKVDLEPKALQSQALSVVNARVAELQKDAKDAQARFEARVAELQKDAQGISAKVEARLTEALEEVTATYADLAARGERFVVAIRKDGVKSVAGVRPKARPAAKKPAAKKAPATKSATRKAPAKKTAAKKAAAEKTAAEKAAPQAS